MKKAGQKYSESNLLLKSICCVAGGALLVLLFMRHAAPVRSSGKGFGSGVQLLLSRNIADTDEIVRWSELNKPSNVFGYNSRGLFVRSVNLQSKAVLPEVRGGMPEDDFLPLPEVPSTAVLPVGMEKSPSRNVLLQPEAKRRSSGFAVSGIPVFSDRGELVCKLEGLSDSGAGTPLLLKAETSGLGTRFRVVESSGNRNFDSRAAAVLQEKVRSGSRFSGILAVWPQGEKEK